MKDTKLIDSVTIQAARQILKELIVNDKTGLDKNELHQAVNTLAKVYWVVNQ